MTIKLIQCAECLKTYPPNTPFVRMANKKEVCRECFEKLSQKQLQHREQKQKHQFNIPKF